MGMTDMTGGRLATFKLSQYVFGGKYKPFQ